MDDDLERYLNRRSNLVLRADMIGGPELARAVGNATRAPPEDES